MLRNWNWRGEGTDYGTYNRLTNEYTVEAPSQREARQFALQLAKADWPSYSWVTLSCEPVDGDEPGSIEDEIAAKLAEGTRLNVRELSIAYTALEQFKRGGR